MSKRRMPLPSQALAISGKGPVAVRVVQAGPEPTQALVEITVDYRNAETPNRAYFADYCDVQKGRFGYSLVFGKLIPGSSVLRTKIEITYPQEMFLRQLWATSRELHKTVRDLPLRENPTPVDSVQDTDKVQTFRSNNVFMGVWGEDSVLDFYYLSPKDMHEARTRQRADVSLEPVIRVVMDTALLYEFLEKCRPFAEEHSRPEAAVMNTGGR